MRERDQREVGRASRVPWVLSYVPELDGLRCFAVAAVIAHHSRVPFAEGGFLGVDLFFVLSGFLITSVLLKDHMESGKISLGRFYIRRALRLWPALVLVCLVCLAYGVLFRTANQAAVTRPGVPASLFYVTNWIEAFWKTDFGLLSHTWSLAIEEQFYLLVAPAVAIILARRVRYTTLAAWLFGGACAVGIYRALLWDGPDSGFSLYRRLDTRADALMIGCALAFVCAAGIMARTALQRRVLQVASLGGIGILAFFISRVNVDNPFLYRRGGLTLVAVCAGVIIYQVVAAPWGTNRVLDRPPVVLLGRMSYSLYLWHNPVLNMWGPVAGVETAIRVLITTGAAALSYFVVEMPFLRLKDRFGGIAKPAVRARAAAKATDETGPGAGAGAGRPHGVAAAKPSGGDDELLAH